MKEISRFQGHFSAQTVTNLCESPTPSPCLGPLKTCLAPQASLCSEGHGRWALAPCRHAEEETCPSFLGAQ